MKAGRVVLLAAALLLLLLMGGCEAAKGKKGKGKKSKEPVVLPAAKLAKYVRCDGCTALATNLFHQAQKLLAEHKGRKKMGEEPVLELLEGICNQV